MQTIFATHGDHRAGQQNPPRGSSAPSPARARVTAARQPIARDEAASRRPRKPEARCARTRRRARSGARLWGVGRSIGRADRTFSLQVFNGASAATRRRISTGAVASREPANRRPTDARSRPLTTTPFRSFAGPPHGSARARVGTGTRRRSARGVATMSTVRVKRKHVLDSDSDESEDEPAPGAKAQIARSDAETRVSEEARGGECASPPGPSEPQRKRLMSAADRAAARRPRRRARPLPSTTTRRVTTGSCSISDLRRMRVTKTRGAGSDLEAYALYPEDPALLGARRSRDASATRWGGTSRGATGLCPRRREADPDPRRRARSSPPTTPSKSPASARADAFKPYQMIGVNFLLLLDEQDVPARSSRTRWVWGRPRRPWRTKVLAAPEREGRRRVGLRRKRKEGMSARPPRSSRAKK